MPYSRRSVVRPTTRTVGLSPKLAGPALALLTAASEMASTAINSGTIDKYGLTAAVTAIMSGVGVYAFGPGDVRSSELAAAAVLATDIVTGTPASVTGPALMSDVTPAPPTTTSPPVA